MRKNKKDNLRQKAQMMVIKAKKGPDWCKSTKLYSEANKNLETQKYSIAMGLAKEAGALYLKEKPLVELYYKMCS